MGLIKEINRQSETDDSAELDYFFDILDHFYEVASNSFEKDDDKTLSLIARSPESCIAKAIYLSRDKLHEQNITLKVVFAHLSPINLLSDWLTPDTSPCTDNPLTQLRWAKRPNLVDAHEQLTLKSKCNWSGESMRRDVNARFGFYIFDETSKSAALTGSRSFNALWKVSETIPEGQKPKEEQKDQKQPENTDKPKNTDKKAS